MKLEAIRIFCDLARYQSFSRAASAHQVSQSAVSQAVRHLEQLLGTRLVDRAHRPPELTPAGGIFFEGCKDFLDRFDRTEARVRALSGDVAGPIHIASIYSVGLYDPGYIRRFMERYPKAHVRLVYLRPNRVYEAVANDEADLGFISYPRPTRTVDCIPWREEEMVLVCHPAHRLAHQKKVRLDQLEGENFVAFDSDLIIRKKVDAALRRRRVSVNRVMEFDNVETMKQAVQLGSGLSILPELTVRQDVKNATLAAIPLQPRELVRPIGIIFKRKKPFTPAIRQFIHTLTDRELP